MDMFAYVDVFSLSFSMHMSIDMNLIYIAVPVYVIL